MHEIVKDIYPQFGNIEPPAAARVLIEMLYLETRLHHSDGLWKGWNQLRVLWRHTICNFVNALAGLPLKKKPMRAPRFEGIQGENSTEVSVLKNDNLDDIVEAGLSSPSVQAPSPKLRRTRLDAEVSMEEDEWFSVADAHSGFFFLLT